MVNTMIDSILKQEFDTYFVYAIDGLNPPCQIYFKAMQYSDLARSPRFSNRTSSIILESKAHTL
jgi:hypothetical protein